MRSEHDTPGEEGDLIWIFGSSRSGSTWLLRMLGELDRVATIDDPHLGHHLGLWRPLPLAWAVGEEKPELRQLADFKGDQHSYFFNQRYAHVWRPALRELIGARFEAEASDQLEGRAPRAVVVKEPGSQAAELLLSLFPGSRLIFLLRDGRDVVDSWLDGHRKGSWAIDGGAFAVAEDHREPLIRWLASVWAHRTAAVRAAFEAHDPDRRVLIRYEDLLADPAGELQRICAMWGLDETRELATRLRAIAHQHDFARLPESRRGAGCERRLARPGSWRTNLTEPEQVAMIDALGPELEWAARGRREETVEATLSGSLRAG